jgi:aldehyde:ferredoxin oxidoreductase
VCVFGRAVTNPNVEFMADTFNAALGTELKPTFFHELGRETLKLEQAFNVAAGFTEADDDLPQFFYDEALKPTNQTARFKGSEVHRIYEMKDVVAQGVPEEYGR